MAPPNEVFVTSLLDIVLNIRGHKYSEAGRRASSLATTGVYLEYKREVCIFDIIDDVCYALHDLTQRFVIPEKEMSTIITGMSDHLDKLSKAYTQDEPLGDAITEIKFMVAYLTRVVPHTYQPRPHQKDSEG